MAELPPPADLVALDWLVIAAYLVLAFGAGLLLARRARGSTENFFLSGRRLPWWLAGTSMVATSFAADTPLVVTGWTRAGGIAGNWRWWSYLVGAVLSAVVFARLWRRSGVLTDVEFMEVRYSGASARFLRAFKALYQVVFLHCFVMGWVVLALTKVLDVLLDLGTAPVVVVGPLELTPAWLTMLGCALVALLYSELAGLWGVVLTDFLQFALALGGAVVLMLRVGEAFGGLGGIAAAVAARPELTGALALAPDGSAPARELWELAIFLGVMWFANKNADGSGVMVQRMLASRDERHALLATLWYVVAHHAVRPWPWILVALASLLVLPPVAVLSPVDGTVVAADARHVVLDPDGGGGAVAVPIPDTGLPDWRAGPRVGAGERVAAGAVLAATDDEQAYPVMMRRYLPAGLLGLLVASLLAAFMSTMDTHVNLASAYVVNDLYRRFVAPGHDERHYLRAARIAGVIVLLLAVAFAARADSVRAMFDWFSALYGGLGVVYVLRWFWWRVNAWSEIAALAASGLATLALHLMPAPFAALLPAPLVEGGEPVFAGMLLVVVAATLLVAVPATLLTPPVAAERLSAFVARVRPLGAWGPVAGPPGWDPLDARLWGRTLLAWGGGIALVLGCLFLPAALVLHGGQGAAAWTVCAVVGGLLTWLVVPPAAPPAVGPARAVTPPGPPPNLD